MNVATLPVAVAKDVVTLAGVATGESEAYTAQKLKQIKEEAETGYARDEKCRIRKYPMTINVRTSTEAFLRQDFASETEAKEIAPVASAKECFLQTGIGPGEAPKDVNLTERATSNPSPFKSISGLRSFNSSVPMWLQRKRKRKRMQMRRYRAKKAKRYVATHPTLPGEELQTVLQAIATEANA